MAKPDVVPMFLQICHIQPNPTSFEINNSNQLSRWILSISRIQVPSTSGLANLRNKFETKCLSGKVLRIYHKCPNGWHQKKLTSRPRNYGAAGVVADRFIPFIPFNCTTWNVSVFGVIPVCIFEYSVSLHIQSESQKIRENADQNNSEYGHILSILIFLNIL